MDTITLRRDGRKDLRFVGEQLAKVSTRFVSGQEQSRWVELGLYNAAEGSYVVSEVSRTLWQGETDSYRATVCGDVGEVYDALYNHHHDTLSRAAKKLLNKAAEEDQAFEKVVVEELGE